MVIYEKAYLNVKNKFIVPLSKHKIRYTSLNKCNIKSMLVEGNIKSIDKIDKCEYHVYIDEEQLFKALLGDIFLMYIRTLLQGKDMHYIFESQRKISANWNIVTAYYHSYFSASLLLRLCFRGTLFLDVEEKKTLEQIFAQFIGSAVSIDSNLVYEIVETKKDGYFLSLKKGDANTHELVWKETAVLMEEIKALGDNTSDEATILQSITAINSALTPSFPSKLRNRVNYQLKYGLRYINNELYHVKPDLAWIHEILAFDAKIALHNDNKICDIYYAYSKYIEIFAGKLIFDYYEILGSENGVIKNLNKKYEDKFVIERYPYDFKV